MIKYRIYTQNKRLKWIKQVLNEFFDGYTIYKTEGYWKGITERSIVIEIIVPDNQFRWRELQIRTLVSMLKGYNKQKSVLVTKDNINIVED